MWSHQEIKKSVQFSMVIVFDLIPIDNRVNMCQLCSVSIELLWINCKAFSSNKHQVAIRLLFDFSGIFDIGQ